ncbi:DNA mismatch repair endonuclease MutL [bacterium]|nr:DNA mismatch repair endonuclease MutL [bacterium]MBU1652901.1 DNA mismatch repair endonuclease MutL [bacterium]MBU1881553.1 DNA mismatch repair endonuclease MutL [bacterium]
MENPTSTLSRKINLLSEEVYNRIAAGEVVERPASVLKELIENALDAAATEIDITVAGGGQSEITVNDNGSGMAKADLLLAFERHATSKVTSVNDLAAIHTLGFRGEALSAIASVARLEATSSMQEALSGHRLKMAGGKVIDLIETGAPTGTTISVKELFFNTPARKKFLKSRSVENSHLLTVFKRFALSYPDIRWSYVSDGKDVYRLPPETLENRLQAIFSEELGNLIFPVQLEDDGILVSGFIGAPKLARKSRGDQFLFVNRRWVQNRPLGFAVLSGFGPLIEDRRFPFYVLFIDIDPELVDVNVHPSKSEVKFRNEHEIYNIVHRGVRQALQKAGMDATRNYAVSPEEKVDPTTGEILPRPLDSRLPHTSPQQGFTFPLPQQNKMPLEGYQIAFQPEAKQATDVQDADSLRQASNGEIERTQVYQFHQRYVVTELKNSIAIIDQHAAHERILYEKALRALNGGKMHSQQLLFPRIMEVSPDRAVLLRDVLEDLQALGIDIKEFGERSFVVEALPAGVKESGDDRIVLDILDELREKGIARKPGHEKLAAAFACRAAIKFGKSLSLPEMNSLIDQLFATQYPFSCPHGRPTILQLTLGELERRFGRS